VLQLFRPKLSQPTVTHYIEVGSKVDIWYFAGPWSCYTIDFDASTHLVSQKGKGYPPSCMADVEPRGRTVRWLWEKWDQIH